MAITAKALNSANLQLETLTSLNANDLITAFKLNHPRLPKRLIKRMAAIPARRFSRQLLAFDQIVGSEGLAAAGSYILKLFAHSFSHQGADYIPKQGPLLVVSNHAGMHDAMALWVGLASRPDLKIIAAERELLQSLPHTSQRLLYVSPQTGGRTGLLRAASSHLAQGGALLTFPAGRIEPDPAVRDDWRESLGDWSASVALLARLAPNIQIIPAAVAGVISATAQRNPLIQLLKTERERDWAAATLQILIPAYRDVHTRLAFGAPLPVSVLQQTAPAMLQFLIEQMVPLLTAVGQAARPGR